LPRRVADMAPIWRYSLTRVACRCQLRHNCTRFLKKYVGDQFRFQPVRLSCISSGSIFAETPQECGALLIFLEVPFRKNLVTKDVFSMYMY
jgi:hypothetical protein